MKQFLKGVFFVGVSLWLGCEAKPAVDQGMIDEMKTAADSNSEVIASTELTQFPEFGLALESPAGFEVANKVADNFAGFALREKGAMVIVQYLPAPFSEMKEGFQRDAIEANRIKVVNHQATKVQSCDGFLIESEMLHGVQMIHQWTLAFGDDKQTYVVSGLAPVDRVDELRDDILASLNSVVTIPRIRQLPYEYDPIEGLSSVTEATLPGLTLLTEDGKLPGTTGSAPHFIILPPEGQQPVDQVLEDIAKSRITIYAEVQPSQIYSTAEISIDGLKGIELKANGLPRKGDTPQSVYFVVLAHSAGGYVTLVGICPEKDEAVWLPRFQKAAHSFRWKK